MSTKRVVTSDELSLIVNSLEIKWQSVKRACNSATNPAVKSALEKELTNISLLQRDIQNKELF